MPAYVSTFSTDDGGFGWFCQTCEEEDAGFRTAHSAREAGRDHDCDD